MLINEPRRTFAEITITAGVQQMQLPHRHSLCH